jgi:hypothetical protein
VTPPKKPSPNLTSLIKKQLLIAQKDSAYEIDQLSQNFEKLAEDVGQFAHGRDAVKEYINSLTEDNKSGRSTRFWLCVLAVMMILAGLGSFGSILFLKDARDAFKEIGDKSVQISIIVSLFGLSFGLMAILVKGAFQRAKSAEVPDILPEHVKMFFESIRPK